MSEIVVLMAVAVLVVLVLEERYVIMEIVAHLIVPEKFVAQMDAGEVVAPVHRDLRVKVANAFLAHLIVPEKFVVQTVAEDRVLLAVLHRIVVMMQDNVYVSNNARENNAVLMDVEDYAGFVRADKFVLPVHQGWNVVVFATEKNAE